VASKTITLLQHDIDGSNATQTVGFTIDGTEYEIDQSDRNANRLRNSFAEFVEHARTVRDGRARKADSSPIWANMSRAGPMRKWLTERGYDVSERGRSQTGCNWSITTITDQAGSSGDQCQKLVTILSLWPPSRSESR
jgi:Lsr2